MSVGDVTSSARGSGARFNDGKPDLSLIPISIIAEYLAGKNCALPHPELRVVLAMCCLADWQEYGDTRYLYAALNELKDPLVAAAHVFEYGAKKYAAWNWAKGMPWSVPVACAGRHALAVINGELNDVESGRPHEGHMACNIIMLAHFARYFPEGNDICQIFK